MPVLLKLHLLTVVVTISGFIIRGIWMLQDSSKLNQTWVKIVPHVNDTILLLSGILLVISRNMMPWEHAWLAAKLIALLGYILLGTIALRRGRTKNQKIIAWILAILVFMYMLGVAKTHSPWPLGFA